DIYLNCEDTGGRLSIIERIFFLYALVLLYILRLKEKAVADYLESCIIPALEELERLVQSFTAESHEEWLLNLHDQKKESKRERGRLNERSALRQKQNKKITKQIRILKKQNQQKKTSKSWKITAHLRKLFAGWRK